MTDQITDTWLVYVFSALDMQGFYYWHKNYKFNGEVHLSKADDAKIGFLGIHNYELVPIQFHEIITCNEPK